MVMNSAKILPDAQPSIGSCRKKYGCVLVAPDKHRELHTHVIKREGEKVRSLPWNAVSFDVELDLAEDNEKTPRLQAVRLLFARGLKEPVETDADKKDW
jgi:hypothetical protein